jgi:hypothetical protein
LFIFLSKPCHLIYNKRRYNVAGVITVRDWAVPVCPTIRDMRQKFWRLNTPDLIHPRPQRLTYSTISNSEPPFNYLQLHVGQSGNPCVIRPPNPGPALSSPIRQGPTTWGSKLQRKAALSPTESEYMAIHEAFWVILPLMDLLEEARAMLAPMKVGAPVVHCTAFEDNSGELELARLPKMRPQTWHINVKYHHLYMRQW